MKTYKRLQLSSNQSLPPISTSRTTRLSSALDTERECDDLIKQLLSWNKQINQFVHSDFNPRTVKQRKKIVANISPRISRGISVKFDNNFDESIIEPRINSSTKETSLINSSIIGQLRKDVRMAQSYSRKILNKINSQQVVSKTFENVRFKKELMEFQPFQAQKSQVANVKNQLDIAIKQSSNIIVRSVLNEFDYLAKEFNALEEERDYIYMGSTDFTDHIELPTLKEILPDLNSYTIPQLIDFYIEILQNKVRNLKDNVYDALCFTYSILKKNIHQTRSINLMFQLNFIQSIVNEAFGHIKGATSLLEGLLQSANLFKLYKIKMMLYYRLAILLNKSTNFEISMKVGIKLLQLSWYFGHREYELRSYQVMSQSAMGQGQLKKASILFEKYVDHHYQEEGYVKDLGIKYTKANLNKKNFSSLQTSFSQDEFDLALIMDQQPEVEKPRIFQNFEQKNLIGDKQGNPKNPRFVANQRVETERKVYNRQSCIQMNHLSYNRNFANYYAEKSSIPDNHIQALYKPTQSVPILVQLMANFKQNYLDRQHNKLLNSIDLEAISIIDFRP